MDRVVWLLDVDGVINVDRPGWGGPPRRGNAVAAGLVFPMRWAPALVERIRSLHRSELVEICWCSTWCGDADEIERLLGLPSLSRAWTDDRTGVAASVAKLAAARNVIATGRRLVWTDDIEVPTEGPVYDELTANGQALLIAPSPRRGLQPAHLDQIESFVRADA